MPHKLADKLYPVTSKFGMRIHPVHKTQRPHQGTDHAMPQGTSVKAVSDGVVKQANFNSKSYGGRVVVEHKEGRAAGYKTSYNHLSAINATNVKLNGYVFAGEEIGKSGGTINTFGAGTSTGAHLHFEVYQPGFDMYTSNGYTNKDAVVNPETHWNIVEED